MTLPTPFLAVEGKHVFTEDQPLDYADAMAAAHKVERDALLDSRHADEALMREALDAMQGAGWRDAYINAQNKLRARLGGV
jgi:hypothetical protein